MPETPLSQGLIDRFFAARKELASIYISPSLFRKSEIIILSAGLTGLCVGSYCGLLMASKRKFAPLAYATVFGAIGFTFGAGLGVQGAFSILQAKRPEFMKAFEKYQLLRKEVLLYGRNTSLLNSDLVIPTHSTDGSIENEVIKIESCPVTEDAEQKLRELFSRR